MGRHDELVQIFELRSSRPGVPVYALQPVAQFAVLGAILTIARNRLRNSFRRLDSAGACAIAPANALFAVKNGS